MKSIATSIEAQDGTLAEIKSAKPVEILTSIESIKSEIVSSKEAVIAKVESVKTAAAPEPEDKGVEVKAENGVKVEA